MAQWRETAGAGPWSRGRGRRAVSWGWAVSAVLALALRVGGGSGGGGGGSSARMGWAFGGRRARSSGSGHPGGSARLLALRGGFKNVYGDSIGEVACARVVCCALGLPASRCACSPCPHCVHASVRVRVQSTAALCRVQL